MTSANATKMTPGHQSTSTTSDPFIGGVDLPYQALTELGDFVFRLGERYEWNHGQTAAFYSLAAALSGHLGKGRP